MKQLLLLLLLPSCATLNTMGMSESCKRLYDACLNTCPGATAAAQAHPSFRSDKPSSQIEVAACTSDCNDRVRNCR